MSEQKTNYKDRFLVPPGALIDKKIYKFLIALRGNIFLKPKKVGKHLRRIDL